MGRYLSFAVKGKFRNRSGLGTSARRFVVKIVQDHLDWTKVKIAQKAYEMELKEHMTGKQDHYASALGGGNLIEFVKGSDEVKVTPLSSSLIKELSNWIVLYWLGYKDSTDYQQDNFKNPTREQIKVLHQMKMLTYQAYAFLKKRDILQIANLVDKSWELKRQSNTVNTIAIHLFYLKGLYHGAISGKLLGSGGNGYFIFMVDPKKRQEFIKKMKLLEVPFKIDTKGVQIREH